MARPAKAASAKRPVTAGRKPGRPKAAPAEIPAKIAKPSAAAKRVATAAPVAPKLSKDELRARVEQLERANTTLRAKNKEANRAAKTAAARIAELEDQLAKLEQQAAPPSVSAKRGPKPAAPARAKRPRRAVDPGDAVPPGVAVQEPAPLDEEAETALENLQEHLKTE
jgi:uncharacterized phage infection (PIP) family protein YhgE